jgi:hypothetical protein
MVVFLEAMAVMGVLMLVIMMGQKKGIDIPGRFKYLIGGILALGLSGAGLYLDYCRLKEVLELSHYGRETMGDVLESKEIVTRGRRGIRRHFPGQLAYDGHTRGFSLNEQFPPGTKLPIVYSTRNPAIAIIGNHHPGFFENLLAWRGGWFFIIMVLGELFVLFLGALALKTCFASKKEFEEVQALE